MTHWQQLLRDGDRAADAALSEAAADAALSDPAADAALSENDAQLIRRVVVAAVQQSAEASRWRPQRVALAAMVVLMVVSAAIADRLLAPRQTPLAASPPVRSSPSDERRQLQFATPGGTRIIWTFNPEFHLKENLP